MQIETRICSANLKCRLLDHLHYAIKVDFPWDFPRKKLFLRFPQGALSVTRILKSRALENTNLKSYFKQTIGRC